VLPPIWQLLHGEGSPPPASAPRILQAHGVTTSSLKRALNHAAAGVLRGVRRGVLRGALRACVCLG
jgi:hypothetical protein